MRDKRQSCSANEECQCSGQAEVHSALGRNRAAGFGRREYSDWGGGETEVVAAAITAPKSAGFAAPTSSDHAAGVRAMCTDCDGKARIPGWTRSRQGKSGAWRTNCYGQDRTMEAECTLNLRTNSMGPGSRESEIPAERFSLMPGRSLVLALALAMTVESAWA